MIRTVIFDMYETLITHFAEGVPLYFGNQIAADAGIAAESFQKIWRAAERERSTGKITLEEIITKILEVHNCYSQVLLEKIVQKRIKLNEALFQNLHPEIIPMLAGLRESGIQIGLISNCFSEEAEVIRKSIVAPYFDALCLSWDLGVQKPDLEIYRRCTELMNVKPEECLYIGDGGSQELEAARSFGMMTAQAAWYLKEESLQPAARKEGFVQLENPLDVLTFINKCV